MKTKLAKNIFLLVVVSLFFIKTSTVYATDGACGSSNGQALPSAPTTDLCNAGAASAVTGSGPWNWTCVGSDATCTDGDFQECTTTDNCAGKKTCNVGAWGGCVKDDSNCGDNNYCNNQGQLCSGDNCVNDCADCPCPSNAPTCNADGSCRGSSGACDPNSQIQLFDGSCISNMCSDYTLVNQCSSRTYGMQCVATPANAPTGLELKPACQTCGCSPNKECSTVDNTCISNGLPESFSWTNKDGKNWLSPVQNQGSCGACWDFAAVAAVEAMYNIEHGAGSNLDLSEQEVLSCSGMGSCGSGGSPVGALDYIKTKGIFPESCSPYVASDLTPCATVCASAKRSFSSYRSPNLSKNLFTFVRDYGPVPINIDDGSYGGHQVLLTGWDINGNILFKNSWGGALEWVTGFNQLRGPSSQPAGTY
ncbi:MAG: C1 family peptidase [Candidatus Moraniibacteriota bacterium]